MPMSSRLQIVDNVKIGKSVEAGELLEEIKVADNGDLVGQAADGVLDIVEQVVGNTLKLGDNAVQDGSNVIMIGDAVHGRSTGQSVGDGVDDSIEDEATDTVTVNVAKVDRDGVDNIADELIGADVAEELSGGTV